MLHAQKSCKGTRVHAWPCMQFDLTRVCTLYNLWRSCIDNVQFRITTHAYGLTTYIIRVIVDPPIGLCTYILGCTYWMYLATWLDCTYLYLRTWITYLLVLLVLTWIACLLAYLFTYLYLLKKLTWMYVLVCSYSYASN